MDNQITPKPAEQIQTSKIIWITVISVFVTALIVGGSLYFWQKAQMDALRQEIQVLKTQNTEPATPEIKSEEDNNQLSSEKYQNDELGIKFSYPKILGELNIQLYDIQLNGVFSENSDALRIGGITKDYTAARSSYYMDFSGFKKEGDEYFWESVGNQTYPIEPKRVVDEDIILVDCTSFEDKCTPTGPTVSVPKGRVAGLINLPNDSLPGMILIADGDVIDENALIEILASFEFIK
ncbi:hypothetical protein A2239_03805 [Candidatus Uhrbacteria bacterium RIFOXYA2_FULL_40_9]|nr:MAG: hypothetical protein UT94_C0033G0002 [Candidatus Uhrbacteria bacterium GW2011_GWF2_40_263]OGL93869.1 MAG: hypothetical protein A2239_03805 [Candidatus Uhrbacteria bacterium RIFOXYA2_FULL_40_9]OGL97778.1 MAG: hypothetical protein A2332_02405 [Candidatus Uhrbacteria bacterium RIFOXYB2_FULL_41_18]HBK35174.1 hypothetical protein [Candidatus Uhrbacteria bacterium]